ncbi:MAG: hypothetical protein ACOYNY_01245 [Caldilineaceae bacterium]|jgi:hypothetical protein
MSMVLEMPVMITSEPARAQLMQERLYAAYGDLFALLKQQYRFVDEERVFTFLRQHSQLVPILQEGRAAVSLIFGEATPIRLTVRRDPEVGLEHLIAWILTDLPVSEAVDRLFELGDTWFNTRLESIGDLLNFNLGRL